MSEDLSKLSKKERKELAKQTRKQDNFQELVKKYFIYGVVALVVIVIGFVWWNNRLDVPQELITRTPDQVVSVDMVKGDVNAPIVLTEYSDFQCPACAVYYPMVEKLVEEFGDNLVFVYRHLPLKQIHFQAELAAQASEAAGKQGMFWEMHDMLFDNQSEWSNNRNAKSLFTGYAEELDLDLDRFTKDISSQDVRSKVEGDYLNALSLRLAGTPSFFLQGERIQNPASIEEFSGLIQAALGEAMGEESTDEDEVDAEE